MAREELGKRSEIYIMSPAATLLQTARTACVRSPTADTRFTTSASPNGTFPGSSNGLATDLLRDTAPVKTSKGHGMLEDMGKVTNLHCRVAAMYQRCGYVFKEKVQCYECAEAEQLA